MDNSVLIRVFTCFKTWLLTYALASLFVWPTALQAEIDMAKSFLESKGNAAPGATTSRSTGGGRGVGPPTVAPGLSGTAAVKTALAASSARSSESRPTSSQGKFAFERPQSNMPAPVGLPSLRTAPGPDPLASQMASLVSNTSSAGALSASAPVHFVRSLAAETQARMAASSSSSSSGAGQLRLPVMGGAHENASDTASGRSTRCLIAEAMAAAQQSQPPQPQLATSRPTQARQYGTSMALPRREDAAKQQQLLQVLLEQHQGQRHQEQRLLQQRQQQQQATAAAGSPQVRCNSNDLEDLLSQTLAIQQLPEHLQVEVAAALARTKVHPHWQQQASPSFSWTTGQQQQNVLASSAELQGELIRRILNGSQGGGTAQLVRRILNGNESEEVSLMMRRIADAKPAERTNAPARMTNDAMGDVARLLHEQHRMYGTSPSFRDRHGSTSQGNGNETTSAALLKELLQGQASQGQREQDQEHKKRLLAVAAMAGYLSSNWLYINMRWCGRPAKAGCQWDLKSHSDLHFLSNLCECDVCEQLKVFWNERFF